MPVAGGRAAETVVCMREHAVIGGGREMTGAQLKVAFVCPIVLTLAILPGAHALYGLEGVEANLARPLWVPYRLWL